MASRDQQAVARKKRTVIQERERDLVLEDDVPVLAARGNRAEAALGIDWGRRVRQRS